MPSDNLQSSPKHLYVSLQLAEEGYASTQANLGMSYAAGQAAVAQNDGEAVRWLRKGANQNNALG